MSGRWVNPDKGFILNRTAGTPPSAAAGLKVDLPVHSVGILRKVLATFKPAASEYLVAEWLTEENRPDIAPFRMRSRNRDGQIDEGPPHGQGYGELLRHGVSRLMLRMDIEAAAADGVAVPFWRSVWDQHSSPAEVGEDRPVTVLTAPLDAKALAEGLRVAELARSNTRGLHPYDGFRVHVYVQDAAVEVIGGDGAFHLTEISADGPCPKPGSQIALDAYSSMELRKILAGGGTVRIGVTDDSEQVQIMADGGSVTFGNALVNKLHRPYEREETVLNRERVLHRWRKNTLAAATVGVIDRKKLWGVCRQMATGSTVSNPGAVRAVIEDGALRMTRLDDRGRVLMTESTPVDGGQDGVLGVFPAKRLHQLTSSFRADTASIRVFDEERQDGSLRPVLVLADERPTAWVGAMMPASI